MTLHDVCAKILVFLFLTLLCQICETVSHNSVPENSFVANLVKQHGYPMERHESVTEDGYILTLYLLPQKGEEGRLGSKTVFLNHGLGTSSDCWFLNHPSARLAFKIYDEGFNVMLGNFRGTTYSKRHVNLTTDSMQYWDFSWDEHGRHDLATMIDYTLKLLGQDKLFLIGHSMGTTTGFVLLSEKPEYNEKLYKFIALAPSVFLSRSSANIRRFGSPFLQPIQRALVVSAAPQHGMFPPGYQLQELWRRGCVFAIVGKDAQNSSTIDKLLGAHCRWVLFNIIKIKEEDIGRESYEALLSSPFETTSVKTVIHYLQSLRGNHFRRFDYGSEAENFKIYSGSPSSGLPPDYDLSRVTCPVSLFWGSNDEFVDEQDLMTLTSKLVNSKKLHVHKIDKKPWDHYDYLLSKESAIHLNPYVVSSLKSIEE